MTIDTRTIVEIVMGAALVSFYLLYTSRGRALEKAKSDLQNQVLKSKLNETIKKSEVSEKEYQDEDENYESLKRSNADLLQRIGLSGGASSVKPDA